jgi:hypothetical protein
LTKDTQDTQDTQVILAAKFGPQLVESGKLIPSSRHKSDTGIPESALEHIHDLTGAKECG